MESVRNFRQSLTAASFLCRYSVFRCYGRSKLAQILYTKELAKRLKEQGANVTVNSLHPGTVNTNFASATPWYARPFLQFGMYLFFETVDKGAATQTYLAISPDLEGVTGKYFTNLKETPLTYKHALDEDLQRKLWDFSVKTISDS